MVNLSFSVFECKLFVPRRIPQLSDRQHEIVAKHLTHDRKVLFRNDVLIAAAVVAF